MKVLVAAKELRLDRTSEGICSSKFVLLLARAKHDVACLTSERIDRHGDRLQAPWLEGIPLRHIACDVGYGWWSRAARAQDALRRQGSFGKYVDQKVDAACAYGTGFSARVWHDVETWHHALEQTIERERPDLVITRGAGRGFEPHMAMLGLPRRVPWVANYHDPYPISLYPEPYRRYSPLISRFQEHVHRRIVRQADALTFPSRRLLNWVLAGPLLCERSKAFVVPHLATDLGDSPVTGIGELADLTPQTFSVIHTGTVIRERNPLGLLRGFLRFVDGLPGGEQARLIFVGRVDADQQRHPEWAALAARGMLIRIEHRVPYQVALEWARNATVGVVLEADGSSSPFFAAKLADYIWLGKPVLALSPRESVSSDLLGADHPLRVSPQDVGGISRALELAWSHHKSGTVDQLTAPVAARAQLSVPALREALEPVFAHTLRGSAGHDQSARRLRHA